MRDHQDLWGGGILMLIGLLIVTHSLVTLNPGTLFQMGPGMVPLASGFIIAALGVAIWIPALFRPGEKPKVDARSLSAILLAILVFVVMVKPFGMVPAIFVQTLVASRADSKLSLVGATTLAACLSLIAFLVFRLGLGIQIAVFSWPG